METKGAITRGRILEAARVLFNTKGFNSTTVSDLVKATGLQRGSLYFHFPGKDAIARAVLDEASAGLIEFISMALNGENPGATLDNYFKCTLEKHSKTGFVGGCIFGNAALEMSDSEPTISEIIDHFFDTWIGMIYTVLSAAQKAGQLRTDATAETMAQLIVASIQGGIMMSRLKKDERPLRECLETLRITLGLQVTLGVTSRN